MASQPSSIVGGGTPWWHDFFDDAYAAYGLANTDPQDDQALADFIIKNLNLVSGQTVFDQCCGIGRISIPLARRGLRVIGVDRVPSYIEAARRRAAQDELECEFHCADACEFVAPQPCDGAINWFTSFGYSPDDGQNIKPLQRAFHSLKPGGRFVLDYLNLPGIFAAFRPWYINRPKNPALEGLIVLHETKPDFMTGMIESEWTFIYPDGRRVAKHVATRMYLPHVIVEMLRRCGFGEIDLLGSREGEKLALTARRCIAVATKP